jgi:hypothetical protein
VPRCRDSARRIDDGARDPARDHARHAPDVVPESASHGAADVCKRSRAAAGAWTAVSARGGAAALGNALGREIRRAAETETAALGAPAWSRSGLVAQRRGGGRHGNATVARHPAIGDDERGESRVLAARWAHGQRRGLAAAGAGRRHAGRARAVAGRDEAPWACAHDRLHPRAHHGSGRRAAVADCVGLRAPLIRLGRLRARLKRGTVAPAMTEVLPERRIGSVTVLFGARGGKYPHGNALLVRGSEESVVIDPGLGMVARRDALPRVDRVLNSLPRRSSRQPPVPHLPGICTKRISPASVRSTP